MPYNILVLKELVKADCILYVVRWTQKCLIPYIPLELPY